MGNSSARDSNLKMYIETRHEYYNSGSIIQGVVFVEAAANFHFDALYIRVEGDEYCQWLEGSSKNRQKYTGSQNFYTDQHILCKFPERYVSIGNYAFPFALQLSENLPGSFVSSDHQAKIQYKLVAYFANFLQKNHNRQIEYIPITIREPFRQQTLCYQGQAVNEPKSCGCCGGNGQVALQANFQKNVSYEGEHVNVEVNIDNSNGNSDINQAFVDLVQYNFYSANSGVWRTNKKVIHTQTLKCQARKGQKGRADHSFPIPTVDAQTAVGTLVANHYRLEAYTKSGMMSNENPCVYSPLFILKKDFNVAKNPKPKNMSHQIGNYKAYKQQYFKSPQYWFKKNRNLDVMNFNLEDNMEEVDA